MKDIYIYIYVYINNNIIIWNLIIWHLLILLFDIYTYILTTLVCIYKYIKLCIY